MPVRIRADPCFDTSSNVMQQGGKPDHKHVSTFLHRYTFGKGVHPLYMGEIMTRWRTPMAFHRKGMNPVQYQCFIYHGETIRHHNRLCKVPGMVPAAAPLLLYSRTLAGKARQLYNQSRCGR
jgi:hypothetical protein